MADDLKKEEDILARQELKLKEKCESLKERKKRLSAKKRKERTKRLIEKGAVVEKLQGIDAENIEPENTQNWLINEFSNYFTDEIPADFFDSQIAEKNQEALKKKINSLESENTKLKYELEKEQKKSKELDRRNQTMKNKFSYFSRIAGTIPIEGEEGSALDFIKEKYNNHIQSKQ